MLHLPSPLRRNSDKEHVISVMSLSEPEPNRLLGQSKLQCLPNKTSPSSPPPSVASPNQRISQTQLNVGQRRLSQFMNSIVTRPIPRSVFPPHISLSVQAPNEVVCAPLPFPSLELDVLSCLDEILSSPTGTRCLEIENFEEDYSSAINSAGMPCVALATSSQTEHMPKEAFCRAEISLSSHSRVKTRVEIEVEQPSLTALPNEIIWSIIACFGEPKELLALGRVCQKLRVMTLDEIIWKPSLVKISAECDIPLDLLNRNDAIPSYIRWCAINRWHQSYLEAKSLLEKLKPENRPSTDEKEKFEVIFAQMMPNVSPWLPTAYSTDEVVLTLPSSISVLPLNNLNALSVAIELKSGAHRHELLRMGLAPTIEFDIYGPSSAKPTIQCKTSDIYHPYLCNTTKHLSIPNLQHIHESSNADSATKIRLLILAIQDCFTSFNSIVSDFTL